MPRPKKQGDTGACEDSSCEIHVEPNAKGATGCDVVGTTITDDADLTPVTTQECYVTLIGAKGIADRIDTLMQTAKERGDDELREHARILKWEFGRLCSRALSSAKLKKKSEAMAIIAQEWMWQHKNIGYDIVHLIRTRCDVSTKDLSILLGVSEQAVIQGVARQAEKIGEQTRLYEDSEKHERADLLMERIYRYIMDPNFPAMDRDKLNAAKAYVELYNKQLERDTSLTWRQVSMISDWFFSELLPTLQQRLAAQNSSVNIRQICLELFEKLTGDMRELSTKIKPPPDSKESEDAKPKLTKSGRPRKKAGRPPKGGKKHI